MCEYAENIEAAKRRDEFVYAIPIENTKILGSCIKVHVNNVERFNAAFNTKALADRGIAYPLVPFRPEGLVVDWDNPYGYVLSGWFGNIP